MKTIAWSEGTWTREPVSISEKSSSLEVEAAFESDWWRTTAYGFIHDDGHALLRDFPHESAIEVSFILNYTEQFDQAGIFITSGDAVTVRAGLDGDLGLLRVAPLDPSRTWSAGPMACAPTRTGLKVHFTKWSEGPADSELH